MDINQAARMIEWLDEERRRDKATIATLEERLAQQQDTVAMLSKRINSMESDQTVIRTQIAPSGRETDLIEQVRKEVVQLIENVEAKRLTAERESEFVRKGDGRHPPAVSRGPGPERRVSVWLTRRTRAKGLRCRRGEACESSSHSR